MSLPPRSTLVSEPAPGDVVPFEDRHLDQALALTQTLGWPYRLEDWKVAADLGCGFAIEAGSRLVGTAFWWPYGAGYGSAGMIIVAPDAQRQGIGARLMDALVGDAQGRSLILISTPEGEALYTRYGFAPYGMIQQRQAVLAAAPPRDPGVTVRQATPADRPAVQALDRDASGMERGPMIDTILASADTVVVERGGRLAGYGCSRRWGRGYVIGPVAAASGADARALITALAERLVGQFVRIDVTDAGGLGPWLDTIGLPQISTGVSMAQGTPPPSRGTMTLYALANQSLG